MSACIRSASSPVALWFDAATAAPLIHPTMRARRNFNLLPLNTTNTPHCLQTSTNTFDYLSGQSGAAQDCSAAPIDPVCSLVSLVTHRRSYTWMDGWRDVAAELDGGPPFSIHPCLCRCCLTTLPSGVQTFTSFTQHLSSTMPPHRERLGKKSICTERAVDAILGSAPPHCCGRSLRTGDCCRLLHSHMHNAQWTSR